MYDLKISEDLDLIINSNGDLSLIGTFDNTDNIEAIEQQVRCAIDNSEFEILKLDNLERIKNYITELLSTDRRITNIEVKNEEVDNKIISTVYFNINGYERIIEVNI